MATKRLEFFATQSDLFQLLDAIEVLRQVNYVRAGLFDQKIVQRFNSAHDIEELSIAHKGDQNQESIFLIIDSNRDVVIREIPQRRGGIKYALDLEDNETALWFMVGGEYQDTAIIAGHIGTKSDDSDAQAIFQLIAKEMRRQFKKIRGNYVGENAIKAMDRGVRLTASLQAPTDTDLRR